MKKRTLFFSGIFALASIVTIGVGNTEAIPCPVEVGKPYRASNSRSVYLVTPECQKQPIKNSDIYFSYFNSWSEVQVISPEVLNILPKYELGFLPWGPKRSLQNGSIIKITEDNFVYYLMNGKLYEIADEKAFEALGFDWNYVEDVSKELLEKYTKAEKISDFTTMPRNTVYKYKTSPVVYIKDVAADGSLSLKAFENMGELIKSGYRLDRIVTLSSEKDVKQRFYADPDGDGVGTKDEYIVKGPKEKPPTGYIYWKRGKDDDNCPTISNKDQSDIDGDGLGDVCDDLTTTPEPEEGKKKRTLQRLYRDEDGDGFGTAEAYIFRYTDEEIPKGYIQWVIGKDADNCPRTYNPLQQDENANSIGDFCEDEPTQKLYVDSNGDGWGDSPSKFIVRNQYDNPPVGYSRVLKGK